MRTDSNYDQMIKIIIIGDSGVGKTCFLNRFCYNTFKKNIQCTVGLEYGEKVIKIGETRVLVQLWDTAGQEKFRNLTPSFYKSAMAIILMFSVDNRESFNSVAVWIKQINTFAAQNVPVLLVCNKADLNKKQISDKQSEALAQAYMLNLFIASCRENINLEESIVELYRMLYRQGKSPVLSPKKGLLKLSTESSRSCTNC